MSSLARRRRLASLEAALGAAAQREAAAAEFDTLVDALDQAVAAAQQRAKADDEARKTAGLPRNVERLVSRDPQFAAELGRITWRTI